MSASVIAIGFTLGEQVAGDSGCYALHQFVGDQDAYVGVWVVTGDSFTHVVDQLAIAFRHFVHVEGGVGFNPLTRIRSSLTDASADHASAAAVRAGLFRFNPLTRIRSSLTDQRLRNQPAPA